MKSVKNLLLLLLGIMMLSVNVQANSRNDNVTGVLYQLTFNIPENPQTKVTGKAIITFDLRTKQDVVLDFYGTPDMVTVYKANKGKGKNAKVKIQNKKVIVPGKMFKEGTNKLEISFTSQNDVLVRGENLIHTKNSLTKGSELFPCFEDVRAQYQTTIQIPDGWKSVLPDISEMMTPNQFSFLVGKFNEKSTNIAGRKFRALYYESNPDKVAQIDDVFKEVSNAMKFMEGYTGITSPFNKECVIYILPTLKLADIDRPGSITLSEKAIYLGKKPTQEDLLRRSEFIAHETAHIWFGHITSIDELWAKEVLANFMASKITRNNYKKDEFELNFMNTYVQNAIALDRTEGAHPIAQDLGDSHNPIWMYDHINYCKAPAMMRMLEDEIGSDVMQKGLQQCLRENYLGHIGWDQIVETLDKQVPGSGVRQFSDVWVKQKGMPIITTSYKNGDIVITQTDPYGRNLCWRQKFEMKVISNLGKSQVYQVDMKQPTMIYKLQGGAPGYIIPNQDGRGYGRFTLDENYVKILPMRLITTRNDLNRYTLLNLIHDNYLQGKLAPSHFGELFRFLGREKNPLIMETAINQMHKIASDLTMQQRYTLELVIMDLLGENKTKMCRQLVLRKLGTSAISPEVLDKLQTILDRHNETVLDEHDYMEIAYRLAVTRPERRKQVLDKVRTLLTTDELKREFEFVSRATDSDANKRAEVFKSLLKPENRQNEEWALKTLRLLNSDVFESQSVGYIAEGLKALPEIQKTNSLSFPLRWTKTLVALHKGAAAKTEVRKFLDTSINFPANLKNYVYESSWVLMNQIPYIDKASKTTERSVTKKSRRR